MERLSVTRLFLKSLSSYWIDILQWLVFLHLRISRECFRILTLFCVFLILGYQGKVEGRDICLSEDILCWIRPVRCISWLKCESLDTRWIQRDHFPESSPHELHPWAFSAPPDVGMMSWHSQLPGVFPTVQTPEIAPLYSLTVTPVKILMGDFPTWPTCKFSPLEVSLWLKLLPTVALWISWSHEHIC